MRQRLAILASTLFIACSSSDANNDAPPTTPKADAGVGSSAPMTPAGMKNQSQACNTLQRTFPTKPTDYFHVFASDDEAVTQMNQFLEGQYHFLAPGSALQTRGQAAVSKLFAAYQKLYPNAVEGMTDPPRVLISDSTEPNAFAFGAPVIVEADQRQTSPYIFVFQQGIFTDKVTDDEITLIAAHELGHLLLRNKDPRSFSHVFYRETPDEAGKIFGEYEPNEPDVETLLTNVKQIGARAGQAAFPQLHGVPTKYGSEALEGSSAGPLYLRIFALLEQEFAATSESPAQCDEAVTQYDALTQFIDGHRDAVNEQIVLGADASKLDGIAVAFSTAATACLAHVKGTYAQAALELKKVEDPNYKATIAAIGNDTAKLATYLDLSKNELEADTASPDENIVTKILGLGQKAQDALTLVYSDGTVKYEQLREFTEEDDADEAAVRIAKVMGLDSDNLANGFFAIYTSIGAGEQVASCKTALAAGTVPQYGGVIDVHHGNCWRGYRNAKLKVALQSCPATWPGK